MQKVLKGNWDQLFIDKMVLQEVKRRKKNLAMGWINYWKPYELAPILGDRELKYDRNSKKCGEFIRENDTVLEGGANLYC